MRLSRWPAATSPLRWPYTVRTRCGTFRRWGWGVYSGAAAIRRELESWTELFEEFEVQIEEILDLGGAATFSVVDQRGRPVGSSGSVQMRFASITEWADRTIVRVTADTDVDEARAAAGRLVESRE